MNIIFNLICLIFISYNICFSNNTYDKNMVFIYSGTYVPLFKDFNNKSDFRNVDSFLIDKYPVTNFEFFLFVLNNPEWDTNNIRDIFSDSGYLNHLFFIDDITVVLNKPVVNVSWFVANAYCDFVLCRLPSIDEWEYVAGAGEISAIGKNELVYWNNILGWYINSQSTDLINISSMPENFFGVFGMHGFIWEWVQDFNSVILLNTDAEGGGLEELLYCGATSTNAIDPADYIAFMRFAFRNTLEANYTMTKLGFRCAKDYE